jgi:UDP-2,3-diacylglucosamine pyrophosphatase LpxH
MLIFIADTHIRPCCPEDSGKFIHWLTTAEQQASDIYILGDLFDYWFTGIHENLEEIVEALASPRIHIIPGNRDFLIANAGELGLHVLREEEVITSPSSTRLLLAHGHTLTRGDYGFKVLHAMGWPVLRLLDKYLRGDLKGRLARFLVRSSASVRTPRAVIDGSISRRRGVDTVICGHLHRGFMSGELIVLPAFFDTGQWLVWDDGGPRIMGGT